MRLRLREAKPGDARLLWHWANEPSTRKVSHNRPRISWSRHLDWFASVLIRREKGAIYVGMSGSRSVGQIRFEVVRGKRAVVSISIDPRFRGKGLGTTLLRVGGRRAARDLGVRRIQAYILRSNEASIAVFRKAGYRLKKRLRIKGDPSVLLEAVAEKNAPVSRRKRR